MRYSWYGKNGRPPPGRDTRWNTWYFQHITKPITRVDFARWLHTAHRSDMSARACHARREFVQYLKAAGQRQSWKRIIGVGRTKCLT